MKNRRPQSVFHRQALLIAAPLIILSAIALYSLRQDKSSVLQSAKSEADSIAPALAGNFAEAIAKGWIDSRAARDSIMGKPGQEQPKYEILEGVVVGEKILAPIDYPPLPAPSMWLQTMPSDQRQILFASEQAIFRKKIRCRVATCWQRSNLLVRVRRLQI